MGAVHAQEGKAPLGLIIDIDGVLVKGAVPVRGAAAALARAHAANVPFVFVTNSGGMTEERKCNEVVEIMQRDEGGVTKCHEANDRLLLDAFRPECMCVAHSPLRAWLRAQGGLAGPTLLVGRRDYVNVARQAGITESITVPEYCARVPGAAPLWTGAPGDSAAAGSASSPDTWEFAMVAVLCTPPDWATNLQIALDVLARCRGARMVVANPDHVYANEYGASRLTTGAFVSCLATLYRERTGDDLAERIEWFGKPYTVTYDYALKILKEETLRRGYSGIERKAIVCIGDNPASDVRGALNAGLRARLVATGVWQAGEALEGAEAAHADVAEAVCDLLEGLQRAP